ncbi:hypothetical protein AZI86_11695 [Bdellovibrio bacteriovorus]|uniref:HTH cro/C1-type domain-containing protein n=1 Tax=Bdellovibrio bacteriovorus TaxID=959 RepID=A0A150WLH4_BDEBC|nr:helix-turn-helix transcriptional regulator [Bdellovibrio bacteriovorus]KYG64859.1 hypothetical protein AZI86_11695 [Bdellovibrio bacteriovorus]
MSNFKSEQIKTVIKDLLKKKKLTYENVAEELECSVPTVKRILGPEELSLPRLLQLCELLDVTFGEIETLIHIKKDDQEEFTLPQQEFLAKNSSYLAYFIALYSFTPEQIAEKYKLNARSTDKYLLQLEKLELIKVTGKLRVKPAFKNLPGLGHGVLAKAYYRNFISKGAEFFIQNISDELSAYNPKSEDKIPKGFSMNATKVSRESYTKFVHEQNKAREAFMKLASYEEKSLPESELQTMVIMHAFTIVDNEDKVLKIVENTLGEIKNL